MKPDRYQHIYERDEWKCVYCGLDGKNGFEVWWHANFNIDHVKPKSKGGDEDENLVVACRACNLYKGNIDCNSIEEGKGIIEKKRRQSKKWYEPFVKKEESS